MMFEMGFLGHRDGTLANLAEIDLLSRINLYGSYSAIWFFMPVGPAFVTIGPSIPLNEESIFRLVKKNVKPVSKVKISKI